MVAIIEDVVVITDSEDTPLHKGWTVRVTVVGKTETDPGRKFVKIGKDYKMQKVFGGNPKMYEAMVERRNEAVKAAMIKECSEAQEDDTEVKAAGSLPKRPRKQMVDEISDILDITIEVADGTVHTLSVLPHWNEQAVLELELKRENLELLKKEPAESMATSFVPVISEPNVKWKQSISSVWCDWYDAKAGKWKIKTMKVTPATDTDVLQANVNKIAAVCQEFYNQHSDAAPAIVDAE